ncbi:MAG: hypothetical protein ACOX68_07445 [Candidatus Limivicinus sp.]|jgi:hypothetical protein
MIQDDTIKLLRECDAGIKMGLKALDEVMDNVEGQDLLVCLRDIRVKHEKLKQEIQEQLCRYCDEGKDPSPVSLGMSWVKTNMKLGLDESDKTIADLLSDGCSMGIKYLNKYLNQYQAADERSKDIAKKLINQEKELLENLTVFL